MADIDGVPLEDVQNIDGQPLEEDTDKEPSKIFQANIFICLLNNTVFLNKEESHPGKCIMCT